MDYDLHRGMRDLGSDPEVRATRFPIEQLLRRAHRRRAARATALGAVGATTVAALTFGGIALTGDLHPDPAPPVVVPTQSATSAPDPTPTSAPEPTESPFEPDLSACGTTRGPTMYDYDTDLTMADVGAPNSEPGEDVHTVVTFGTSQQWAGDRVSVAPLEAVLTNAADLSTSAESTVIAVPAAPLRAPSAQVLIDGTMGAPGAGALLAMDIPFVMCPGTPGAGSSPPAGSYTLWFEGRMVHDGTTLTNRGAWLVTVGAPPEQPSVADDAGLPPQLDMPAEQYRLDLGRCGSSTAQLDAIAGSNPVITGGTHYVAETSTWYRALPSGQATLWFRTEAGWWADTDSWPGPESSEITVLDAVVAPATPGDHAIWGTGPMLSSGPVAGLLAGPVTPFAWNGPLSMDLPITWCDGSTTVPDGVWALYVKVQQNVSGTGVAPWSSTGIFWVAQVLAVGPDAYPGTWPY